jgi:cellulose synthase/poly-beta-1,6-N-acetylglucosamine synthase-like glycosyltransferase
MYRIKITRGIIVRLATVAIFLLLSIASFVFAGYLFIEANSTYIFALACAFLILAAFAGFFNVYASLCYFRSYFYDQYIDKITAGLKPLTKFPTVAVMMPVYNEEPQMVKKNLSKLIEMNYPKDKISYYLLDDSTKKEITKNLREFCKKSGITFIHRENRSGCKAGALNYALKVCNEEFIAIFDADESLIDKNFVKDLLPYFGDKSLSYIQTEKRYSKGNLFSEAVDLFDAFFFKFIQPHRALNNTAIFAGSCGIIRTSYLKKLKGFPEYVIEDTFFSLESDLHNYKSLYIPKVYALGIPIVTYSALVRQQWRYNYGDTQFISYYFKRSMKEKKIPFMSNLDYWSHGFGLNYLSIMLLLFTGLSIFISFSALPLTHLTLSNLLEKTYITRDLEIFGGIAFVLSFIAPVVLTRIYFGSYKKGFMVFALNFALAIIRAKAAISAILKKDPLANWTRVSGKPKRNILTAIVNTKFELGLSALLVSLGYIAYLLSNVAGFVWLSAYGILYLSSTIFLYKYG